MAQEGPIHSETRVKSLTQIGVDQLEGISSREVCNTLFDSWNELNNNQTESKTQEDSYPNNDVEPVKNRVESNRDELTTSQLGIELPFEKKKSFPISILNTPSNRQVKYTPGRSIANGITSVEALGESSTSLSQQLSFASIRRSKELRDNIAGICQDVQMALCRSHAISPERAVSVNGDNDCDHNSTAFLDDTQSVSSHIHHPGAILLENVQQNRSQDLPPLPPRDASLPPLDSSLPPRHGSMPLRENYYIPKFHNSQNNDTMSCVSSSHTSQYRLSCLSRGLISPTTRRVNQGALGKNVDYSRNFVSPRRAGTLPSRKESPSFALNGSRPSSPKESQRPYSLQAPMLVKLVEEDRTATDGKEGLIRKESIGNTLERCLGRKKALMNSSCTSSSHYIMEPPSALSLSGADGRRERRGSLAPSLPMLSQLSSLQVNNPTPQKRDFDEDHSNDASPFASVALPFVESQEPLKNSLMSLSEVEPGAQERLRSSALLLEEKNVDLGTVDINDIANLAVESQEVKGSEEVNNNDSPTIEENTELQCNETNSAVVCPNAEEEDTRKETVEQAQCLEVKQVSQAAVSNRSSDFEERDKENFMEHDYEDAIIQIPK